MKAADKREKKRLARENKIKEKEEKKATKASSKTEKKDRKASGPSEKEEKTGKRKEVPKAAVDDKRRKKPAAAEPAVAEPAAKKKQDRAPAADDKQKLEQSLQHLQETGIAELMPSDLGGRKSFTVKGAGAASSIGVVLRSSSFYVYKLQLGVVAWPATISELYKALFDEWRIEVNHVNNKSFDSVSRRLEKILDEKTRPCIMIKMLILLARWIGTMVSHCRGTRMEAGRSTLFLRSSKSKLLGTMRSSLLDGSRLAAHVHLNENWLAVPTLS